MVVTKIAYNFTDLNNAVTAFNGDTDDYIVEIPATVTTISFESSQLFITKPTYKITVVGLSRNNRPIFDANNASRHFTIQSGSTIEFLNIEFKNGETNSDGGSILNNGTIELIENSTFSNNNTSFSTGGGIYNAGTITSIENSTFFNNNAKFYGGGISNRGTITSIKNSTFSNNSAEFWGGGIYNGITITSIENSTFSNNMADDGQTIYNAGTMKLNNVTILSRQSKAFYAGGILTVTNGLFAAVDDDLFPLQFYSALNDLNLSTGGNILFSTANDPAVSMYTGDNLFITNGYNPENLLSLTLMNNGGLTETLSLPAGSPAINYTKVGATNKDQRGYAKVNARDSGAFEFVPPPPPPPPPPKVAFNFGIC